MFQRVGILGQEKLKDILITFFLPATMKKVLYRSPFPTLSTRAGVDVVLLGLTWSGSKRYGVVPCCSSTIIQLFSSFSSPDDDCSTLLPELLLLSSSAMFSVFPGHLDDVTRLINLRTCLRAKADICQLSIKSRLSCFMSYF